MSLTIYFNENKKIENLEFLLNKVSILKHCKNMGYDYLNLLKDSSVNPIIRYHVLDRIVIMLNAEIEYYLNEIFRFFFKKHLYVNKIFSECLLNKLDKRSLKYKDLKNNTAKFIENYLLPVFNINSCNFNKDFWKQELDKKFTTQITTIFSDFNNKKKEYITNIWNSILGLERNKIAHKLYQYMGNDYYVFYTIVLADIFLFSVRKNIEEILIKCVHPSTFEVGEWKVGKK